MAYRLACNKLVANMAMLVSDNAESPGRESTLRSSARQASEANEMLSLVSMSDHMKQIE